MNPESSIYFYIYVCMLVYTKENKTKKKEEQYRKARNNDQT